LTFSGAAAIETCRGGETVGVPRVKVAELPIVDVLVVVLLTKAAGEDREVMLLLGLCNDELLLEHDDDDDDEDDDEIETGRTGAMGDEAA
jgi:hypothetical protein